MAYKLCLATASAVTEAAIDVVLDTNVVLDWLVFEDPSVRAIVERIDAGAWRWIGTPAMLDELSDVLSRDEPTGWRQRAEHARQTARARCSVAVAAEAPVDPALRCADPDDQKFIDLAVARRVPYLFSRDKALLSLARAASRHGVAVLRPAAWSSLDAEGKRAAEAAR